MTFALGVFIGVLPGVGPAFAFLLAILLRLSKMVILLGTLVTNPWTVAFVYAGSYQIGAHLLRRHETVDWSVLLHFEHGWWQELEHIAVPLGLGGVILGIFMALISYVLVRLTLHHYRMVRLRRLEMKGLLQRK